MGDLINLNEAAGYICRSPKTVRRMCAARELPHLRLHNRILIDKKDLDAFLAGLRVPVIDNTAKLRQRV